MGRRSRRGICGVTIAKPRQETTYNKKLLIYGLTGVLRGAAFKGGMASNSKFADEPVVLAGVGDE
jgi:hypothetical protein